MKVAVLKGLHDKSNIIISSEYYAIGRCKSADFIIAHVSVSRNHCKIIKENKRWKIDDFSSSGTFVNDALVGKGKSLFLNDGDTVRFGPRENNLCWTFYSSESSAADYSVTNASHAIVKSSIATEEINENKKSQTVLRSHELKGAAANDENERNTHKIIEKSGNAKHFSVYEKKENIQEKSESEKIEELTKELQEVQSALNVLEEKNSALQVELAAGVKDKAKAETNLLGSLADLIEAEFQCTICSELFVTAITLSCTHTFCKYCINQWKKKQRTCPICRKKITNETRSLVVDNYIDKVVGNLSQELKERREIIIKERNEIEPCRKKSKLKKNDF